MLSFRGSILPAAVACCTALSAVAAEPDWAGLVGPYPQPGTLEAREDLAVMLWLQRARTTVDVGRARSEGTPSLGCFAHDLKPGLGAGGTQVGPVLNLHDYPMTAALLAQARADIAPVIQSLQNLFARPRPYLAFPAVAPALPLPSTPSYPSSHAAVGALYAQILAQFVPMNREAILQRGALLGDDRVMGGVHYPSDVTAGQKLGKVFATSWITAHREEIVNICGAEWRK
jgi:hypothetical protein